MRSLAEAQRVRASSHVEPNAPDVRDGRTTSAVEVMNRGSDMHGEIAAELIDRSAYAALHVCGSSMHPTIRKGDVVRVVRCEPRSLQLGDVLLLHAGNMLCVHRLVRVVRGRGTSTPLLQTAGDAVGHLDAPIPADSVIGKVQIVERDGRVHSLDSFGHRLAGTGRVFLAGRPRIRQVLRGGRRALRVPAKIRRVVLQWPPPGEMSSREN